MAAPVANDFGFPSVSYNKKNYGVDFGLNAAYKAVNTLFNNQASRQSWYAGYFGGPTYGVYDANTAFNQNDAVFFNNTMTPNVRKIHDVLVAVGKWHANSIADRKSVTDASIARWRAPAYDYGVAISLASPTDISPPKKQLRALDNYFLRLGENLNLNPMYVKTAFANLLVTQEGIISTAYANKVVTNCHGNGNLLEQMKSTVPQFWGIQEHLPYNSSLLNFPDLYNGGESGKTKKRKSRKRKSYKRNKDFY
jgi:hypothetical protein